MFDAEAVALFGLSYDTIDVLAAFSASHGITFDLLSDQRSEVIRDLGLLNRDIDAQQAHFGDPTSDQYPDRYRGLPHPGVLVIDEHGLVTEKHFEKGYRDRPSGGYLLRKVANVPTAMSVTASIVDGPVRVSVGTENTTFRALQTQMLFVHLEVAAGFHVYTDPVPTGYVPLSVDVRSEAGVQVSTLTLPMGRLLEIEELAERLFVLEDLVELQIPFKLGGARYHVNDGQLRDDPLTITEFALEVVVRYQVCNDRQCFPPGEQRLSIVLSEDTRRY